MPVLIDTYPDFRIDLDEGPRGHHAADQGHPVQQPGEPDRRRGHATTKSAAWRSWRPRRTSRSSATRSTGSFCYDEPFVSPAKFNDQTIVIDGFSQDATA